MSIRVIESELNPRSCGLTLDQGSRLIRSVLPDRFNEKDCSFRAWYVGVVHELRCGFSSAL